MRRALLLLALLGAGCHRRPTAQPAGPRLQVRVARAASAVENESAVAVPLERALAPLVGRVAGRHPQRVLLSGAESLAVVQAPQPAQVARAVVGIRAGLGLGDAGAKIGVGHGVLVARFLDRRSRM